MSIDSPVIIMRCSLLGLNDESRWTGSSVTLSQRTSMFLTELTGRACTFAFTLPTGQYYQYLYKFPRFRIHLFDYETQKSRKIYYFCKRRQKS